MTPPNPKVTAPERETDEQRASFEAWAQTYFSMREVDWPPDRYQYRPDTYDDPLVRVAWESWLEAQRLAREDERQACADQLVKMANAASAPDFPPIVKTAMLTCAGAIRFRQPGGAK